MSRVIHRVLLVVLCAACSLLAGTAAVSAHPLVGIADNSTQVFGDPRFLALGITVVRDDIPWNAINNPVERASLTLWLDAAEADGLTPLITFDHQNGGVRTELKLPSVAQFSSAFQELRALFPWVTEFETWDEANFYLEGTAKKPKRAAQYYLALRRDCRSCTILAPDVLDVPKTEGYPLAAWAHKFIHYVHTQPPVWGLNNYVGANSLRVRTTKLLLHAVRGSIWFTETGGIVSLHNGSHFAFSENPQHAAKVDRFILTKLANLSPRIKRVYLYDWNVSQGSTWDSALIAPDGQPRPGYDVLANTLDGWGITPNCALSTVPPACADIATPAAWLRAPFTQG
jgi:hypothetical protein